MMNAFTNSRNDNISVIRIEGYNGTQFICNNNKRLYSTIGYITPKGMKIKCMIVEKIKI